MSASRGTVKLAVAAAALLAFALLGCSGVGDGGVGGTDDFLNRGAEITSDSIAGLVDYVRLQETSGSATTTCISLDSRSVNVFSVAFTLEYDPALLNFTGGSSTPSCLGTGTEVLALTIAEPSPGTLVVGLTRNAAVVSGGVSCGRLLDLCFDVIGEGTAPLEFVPQSALLDSTGATILDEAGFVNATVTTQL